MSEYYGSLRGAGKTQATRTGGKKSGIAGHIRSWKVGVEVASGQKADTFDVYLTSGSGETHARKLIGTAAINLDGVPIWIAEV